MADPWNLVKRRRYSAAVEEYSRLHKAEPDNYSHLNNRGIALLLLGDGPAALADFRYVQAITAPRYRNSGNAILSGVCAWYMNQPDDAIKYWHSGLDAPYTDAAGGIELPALLFFAGVRLRNEALVEEASRLLRSLWQKHQRRQRKQRPRSEVTHEELVHPGLLAWPGAVVPFLLGEIEAAVLRACAKNTFSSILRQRWQCAADFYLGVRALQAGNTTEFRKQIRHCAGSKYGVLEHEYLLARWEVKRRFPDPPFPLR